MKNILSEKADGSPHGRLLASVDFISAADIAGKEILDIGCGYGWCELNLLKRGVKKITATEVSDKDLETIRRQVIDPRLRLVVASACALPFTDNSFDAVISWEVIEHLPKNTEFLMFKEVFRVLKPGGCFYLSTPFNYFWANIFDPAWYFGHRHYSLAQLYKTAREQDFKVIEAKIAGRHWTTLSIVNLYFSKWVLRRQRIFNDFFNHQEDKEFFQKGFSNIFIKLQK